MRYPRRRYQSGRSIIGTLLSRMAILGDGDADRLFCRTRD
jgi:hypothetical protein